MLDPLFLFVLLSFTSSFVIFAFYFSSIVGGRGPNKRRLLNGPGMVTSFSGAAIGAVFSLSSPYIPAALPLMDLGVVCAAIAWIALLNRFSGTGFFETLPHVFLAIILYVVIIAVTSAFSFLILA